MKKAFDAFRTLEKVLLVLPMAFLCICIFVNILMRAFFKSGISWLEEFSRYVFVFSTFLGASIAVESDQHPKMTAVIDAVPAKISLVLKIVGNLFCAVLSLVVTYYGYQQILKMIANGTMASSVPVPMYVPYLIIPLGMLVAGIRYLYQVWKNIRALGGSDSTAAKGGVEE